MIGVGGVVGGLFWCVIPISTIFQFYCEIWLKKYRCLTWHWHNIYIYIQCIWNKLHCFEVSYLLLWKNLHLWMQTFTECSCKTKLLVFKFVDSELKKSQSKFKQIVLFISAVTVTGSKKQVESRPLQMKLMIMKIVHISPKISF